MSDDINIGGEEIVTFTAVPSVDLFVDSGTIVTSDTQEVGVVVQNLSAADSLRGEIVITPNEYVFTLPE